MHKWIVRALRRIRSWRGMAARCSGGSRDSAFAGTRGRGRGGPAHSRAPRRAPHPVPSHVRASSTRPSQRGRGGSGGRPAVSGRARASADLRVALRLRELRSSHRGREPSARHGVRRCWSCRWVVRPLIYSISVMASRVRITHSTTHDTRIITTVILHTYVTLLSIFVHFLIRTRTYWIHTSMQ